MSTTGPEGFVGREPPGSRRGLQPAPSPSDTTYVMRNRAWIIYPVVAGALTAAWMASGRLPWIFNVTGLLSPILILVALKLWKPQQRLPWVLFAIGQFVFIAGDVVSYNYETLFNAHFPTIFPLDADGYVPFPGWADGLLPRGVRVPHRRHHHADPRADAGTRPLEPRRRADALDRPRHDLLGAADLAERLRRGRHAADQVDVDGLPDGRRVPPRGRDPPRRGRRAQAHVVLADDRRGRDAVRDRCDLRMAAAARRLRAGQRAARVRLDGLLHPVRRGRPAPLDAAALRACARDRPDAHRAPAHRAGHGLADGAGAARLGGQQGHHAELPGPDRRHLRAVRARGGPDVGTDDAPAGVPAPRTDAARGGRRARDGDEPRPRCTRRPARRSAGSPARTPYVRICETDAETGELRSWRRSAANAAVGPTGIVTSTRCKAGSATGWPAARATASGSARACSASRSPCRAEHATAFVAPLTIARRPCRGSWS